MLQRAVTLYRCTNAAALVAKSNLNSLQPLRRLTHPHSAMYVDNCDRNFLRCALTSAVLVVSVEVPELMFTVLTYELGPTPFTLSRQCIIPLATPDTLRHLHIKRTNTRTWPEYTCTVKFAGDNSLSHTLSHRPTLFKNTQQTCMNKMQMTITKEKKITTHT